MSWNSDSSEARLAGVAFAEAVKARASAATRDFVVFISGFPACRDGNRSVLQSASETHPPSREKFAAPPRRQAGTAMSKIITSGYDWTGVPTKSLCESTTCNSWCANCLVVSSPLTGLEGQHEDSNP